MNTRIISLLCLTVSLYVSAVVVESDKHAAIKTYIKDNKTPLIIYDLDNTLVAPTTDAGSDQWFGHELQTRNINDVLPEYFALQEKVTLELTEKKLPQLFKELYAMGAIIIGLTARSPELEERTLSELDRLGIEFSHIFKQDDITDRSFHYHRGIIFAGSRNKGEVLKEIMEQADLHPDHIVFSDDKLKNITPVEQTVEKLEIEFTGVRYSKLDERVNNFNPETAEVEKRELLGA